ncbi:MAG: FliH/SctL family protein [Candidatus Caenarcaniphilales bacterium]|nr:FliH/SctL family protein [Candidatus Caenarcaniphilales bacterium]
MLIKNKIFSNLTSEFGVIEEEQIEEEAQDIVAKTLSSYENNSTESGADKETLLKEIQSEGEEIINRSREEAQGIIDSAEKRIQEEIDKAIEEKLSNFDDLEKKALAEIESLMNTKKEIVQESQKTIVDLSIELAAKIIGKKVKEDPSILQAALQEVIDQMLLNPDESIKLNFIVNPRDERAAKNFSEDLEKKSNSIEINVKTDESIMEGSCIAETPSGSLDLNFSTQLQIFKERMSEDNM